MCTCVQTRFWKDWKGFTLVELLVVGAIIGILAGVLLPTLVGVRERATAVACMGNLKQLQLAFHFYADDQRDFLSPSETDAGRREFPRWVDGSMVAAAGSEVTNRQLMLQPGPGHLGPYLKVADVFHCPGDRSRTNIFRTRGPLRARSYTMNTYMVAGDGMSLGPSGEFVYSPTAFVRYADFSRTSPAAIFVFLDEHEATIAQGIFPFAWRQGRNSWWNGHWPAGRHGGQGMFSFADGHAEMHRWKDPRTGMKVRSMDEVNSANMDTRGNPDFQWVWDRANDGVPHE